MQTKFHLLPVGHHFEWEGKQYVKSTPLVASQIPEGGQRFIPRSALVTLLGESGSVPATVKVTPSQLDAQRVRTAISLAEQRCQELLATAADNASLLSETEQIFRELLAELELA